MIEAQGLFKYYGPFVAVGDLSFEIPRGQIVAMLGPNGAGKTTTMRILATLLNPTWGEASVCGYSIYNNSKEIRRLIGNKADSASIRQAAMAKGMVTLKDEGAEKVFHGVTTTEELMRITQQEVEI